MLRDASDNTWSWSFVSPAKALTRLQGECDEEQFLGISHNPSTPNAQADLGVDIAKHFFDGRTASELRLWDALNADLLVPFHYLSVSDDEDLSQLERKRGNYDTAPLNDLDTGSEADAATFRPRTLGPHTFKRLG